MSHAEVRMNGTESSIVMQSFTLKAQLTVPLCDTLRSTG